MQTSYQRTPGRRVRAVSVCLRSLPSPCAWRPVLGARMLRAVGAQQVPVFRAGVDLVNLGVTVTDQQGQLVTDLTAGRLRDLRGRPASRPIRYFAAGEAADADAPGLHLGLLLDVSESMGDDMRLHPDRGDQVPQHARRRRRHHASWTSTPRCGRRVTARASFARLVERIRQQKVERLTALYDAIGVYLDGAAGRTGGRSCCSTPTAATRAARMRLSRADGSAEGLGRHGLRRSAPLEHQSPSAAASSGSVLQQIAEATGGQAFFPTSVKELDKVYEQVLAEIRAQYTLGYLSTNEQDRRRLAEGRDQGHATPARTCASAPGKGYFAPLRSDPSRAPAASSPSSPDRRTRP